jgi:hypothetical protein
MSAPEGDAPRREAAAVGKLLANARQRGAKAAPPRFLGPAANTMARHTGIVEENRDELLSEMALWQLHLPAALGAEDRLFHHPERYFPHSYRIAHEVLAEVRDMPLFVMAAFHMACFPFLAALLAQATTETTGRQGHVLIAQRNAAWLDLPGGRWVREVANVLLTSQGDLRRLLVGLRTGEVRRLLILSDGPQPPGTRGVRLLDGISPTLGFGDGLLRRLLEVRAPVRPISHVWSDDRLELRWHPFLPADPDAGVDAYATLLEDLLRRHPEQWLNWAAASVRT